MLQRTSRARVVTVRFDGLELGLLAIQTADKTVEVLRMRAQKQVSKKVKRKLKRKREKAKAKAKTAAVDKSYEDRETEGGAASRDGDWDANGAGEAEVTPADEFEQLCVIRVESKL
eukprot:SAG11_NODE_258_length_11542_cov_35.970899_13_plen_116_part_00